MATRSTVCAHGVSLDADCGPRIESYGSNRILPDAPILLRCSKCNATMDYSRKIDDAIPNDVKTIVSICPKCDDGDFHTETWLDACGFELAEPLNR